jgi:tRNA pseudouridine55 synthase
MRVVSINKALGETPLQALERYRANNPNLERLPLTYAGRLDPMAEGKLIILIGDECKRKDKYTALDKEYEFEILFGFKSDTGDVLGLVEKLKTYVEVRSNDLANTARDFTGEMELSYPVFSSKTVMGKPLFEYALEGRISDIDIPTSSIHLYKIKVLDLRNSSFKDCLFDIENKLSSLVLSGDNNYKFRSFRRDAVLSKWREILKGDGICTIARFRAVVSSGTYIRSLASEIAKSLGTEGLAYSIRRTKIGKYTPFYKGFGVWTKRF